MADAAKKAKILQSAQKLVQKGQYDKAIKELLLLVKDEPKDVRIWLKIGDLHAKRGAAPEAIDTYLKVAEFYSEQGFHLKAIAVYRQILSIDPGRIEFNLKLAEIYAHLALVRESFDQYEMVANAYLRANRNGDAVIVLQRMVLVDPENIPNRIKLAEMLSREGRKDDAADEFAGAAARLEAAGRIDDFLKVGERLVYHRPEDAVTLKRLAYLYIERRDPKRALAKLQQAFKLAPNDAETLGFLAQAFRGIGQIPKTIQVLKELCTLLDRDGRRSDRDEVWRQILELDPRDADAQRALGVGTERPSGVAQAVPASQQPRGPAPIAAPPRAAPPARAAPARAEDTTTSPRSSAPARAVDFDIEDDDGEMLESGGARTVHDQAPEGSAEELLDDDMVEEVEDESGAVAAAAAAAWAEPKHDPARDAPPPAAAVSLFGRGMGPGTGAGGANARAPGPVAAATPAAIAADQAGGEDEVSKILQETDIYIKYGLHSKAIEHVRKVLSHESHHVGALQRLGDLYIGNGSYEEAVKVLLLLSEAHSGRGDRDAAVAVLQRAVEIKPDEREVQTRLSALGRPVHTGEEDTPIEALIDEEEDDERTPVGELMFSGDMTDDGLAPEALFEDETEIPELLAGTGPASGARGGRGPNPLEYDGERSLLDDFSEIPIGDAAIEDGRRRSGGRRGEELDADHGSGPILGAGLVPSVPSGTRPSRSGSRPMQRIGEEAGAPPATGASAEAEIVDALEEADFFVAQGLLDEARAIVDDTRERYPTDRRLLGKQLELAELLVDRTHGDGELRRRPAQPASAPAPAAARDATAPPHDQTSPTPLARDDVSAEVDQSIEFAQQLSSDVAEELVGFSTPASGASAIRPDDEVYTAMRQSSVHQVQGDSATRFDLAIAYKEMGLLDAAVEEFRAVLDAKFKMVECWQLIGLCLVEKGDFPHAVAAFKSGLAVDGISPIETIGMYYELGAAYEVQNDLREALYYFENVDRRDPRFRGVRSRVAALRARVGAPQPARIAESGASPLPVPGLTSSDVDDFELAAHGGAEDGESYH